MPLIRETSLRVEAEKHLAQSEAKYRGLLEAAPDAMVVVNQDGAIVLLNIRAEEQFGYSRDELLGQKVKIIIPEGFAERLVADGLRSAAEALAQQIGTGIELNGRRKNGSDFPIEIMLSPLDCAEGILVTAAIRDITTRKDAEKRLAQTEAKYRGLLEAAPNGIVVMNRHGEIVLLNVRAELQFGYSRDELLGQKVKIIIPEGLAERLLAHGSRSSAETFAPQAGVAFELQGRRKNGSDFPIEIMLNSLENAEGILVTAAIRDITTRKNAEQHLAQTEAKYRGLLEAAPDAMVVVNEQGEIVLLNIRAEEEFGYSRDELLGQKVTTIIPEGFAERLVADGLRSPAEALAQHIGTGIELHGRRKNGGDFPIEIMLSPLDSAEGILVTAAIRDITTRKKAERHLAQTEAKYRGLLEAAPDAMVVVNEQGEIVLLNIRAEEEFGYSRDELLGQKVTTIVPEGFAERLVADGLRSPAEALAQHIGTGIELHGRRKNGGDFPIEIMLSPLDSAEGILVTAAIRDITTRKNAERHLAQTEAKYRGLLEAAPDAMVVVNEQGEIVLLNIRAEEEFGYSRDELLGQKVKTIVPEGFAERLVADGLRSPAEALAQHIGTGIELHGRRKNGGDFPIEIMLSPLDSAEGILVTAAIRDITTRKNADRHLAQTEAKYRGLLEAAPDAMVVVNEQGEIVLLNIRAEEQFGYSRDELLGQKVTTIVPEGFAERLVSDGRRSAAEALAQQIGTGIELHGHRKNGSDFPIEIMLSPLDSAEGILVTAAIRDITTRKEAEKRSREFVQAREVADQANQAKSRFLAGITHELRTPLHGILGYAELLSLEGGLNPKQLERLEAMMAAGQSLLGTINAVLDMSQIEADQMELRPAEIELPGLVCTCLDVVRPAAEAKKLALALAPSAPLRLFADPTRLRQVLINLLGNAVKFTPAGAVEVRLRQIEDGAGIRLEVADTGPGIWVEHRDKLFGTFERLNAEAVSGIEGTGLGLAIAARLVKLMGGRIGYADNPGGGSVFWLELPCGAVASAAVGAAVPSTAAGRPRLRVLVVDDEPLNRNIATEFLSIAGHAVICVDNGAAAVEAAAAEDFDVILMDVRMPGMNGLEATRLIHALPAPRGTVRVIAVTAQAFAQQIEICRQAGMDGHVSKPFKQAVLLAALANRTTTPGGTELAVTPPAAAQTSTASEPPVLDRAAYEEVTEYLSPADLQENLRTLITRGEALLHRLRTSETLPQFGELAEAAHKLAGGAGTFGFLSVAAAARRFELAADMGEAETVRFADHLATSIKASLTVVRQELAAMAVIAN